MNDPIVNAVRNARKAIERECAEEGRDMGAHFKEYQKRYSGRLVSRKSRKALRANVA